MLKIKTKKRKECMIWHIVKEFSLSKQKHPKSMHRYRALKFDSYGVIEEKKYNGHLRLHLHPNTRRQQIMYWKIPLFKIFYFFQETSTFIKLKLVNDEFGGKPNVIAYWDLGIAQLHLLILCVELKLFHTIPLIPCPIIYHNFTPFIYFIS